VENTIGKLVIKECNKKAKGKMQDAKIKMKNLKFKIKNWHKGFSIMELAVVLAIFVILTAVGIVVWFSSDELASRNNAIISTNALLKAMAMYKGEQGDYPPEGADLVITLSTFTNVTPLLQPFRKPPIGGTPANGVQIYRNGASNDVVCIWGELKDVTGEYEVRHCTKTNGADAAGTGNEQPACLWQGIHSWRACSQGM